MHCRVFEWPCGRIRCASRLLAVERISQLFTDYSIYKEVHSRSSSGLSSLSLESSNALLSPLGSHRGRSERSVSELSDKSRRQGSVLYLWRWNVMISLQECSRTSFEWNWVVLGLSPIFGVAALIYSRDTQARRQKRIRLQRAGEAN